MVIKVRRGTSAGFSAVTLQDGELAFLTDTKELYIGYSGTKYNLTNPLYATLYNASGTWSSATAAFTITTTGYRFLSIELSNTSPTDCKGSLLIPCEALPTSGAKTYRIPYDGSYVAVVLTYASGSYSVKRTDTSGAPVTFRTFRGIR